jgi:hypothetical protein
MSSQYASTQHLLVYVCVWRGRESARAPSERASERGREREGERERNLAKRMVRAKTHAHIGARADPPATLVPMWPLLLDLLLLC